MKFNFNVDKAFVNGIERLTHVLGFEIGDGITVSGKEGDRVGVSLHEGEAVIYYIRKNHFFRELGILVENAKKSDCFDIFENEFFSTVGIMLDVSNYHVIALKGMKKMLDYLAVMGYNMAMLYTEDTVTLDSRKYFGYLRGRYTREELREIDDYAYEYGIEMIPCIECYGHMQKYLVWPEANDIKDTADVLLARETKTFEFLDELISTVSSCYRSRRIHIGMDEAHSMGKGKFLEKHGIVDKNVIFDEFMTELCKITDRHGLTPMMWSDMYFRNNSERLWYYDVNARIPESIKERIPKNLDMVFWHYGEEPGCDDAMIKMHQALDRKVIFAAGTWCWSGHFPECNYAFETVKGSLDACRKNNVREMMTTIWSKGDSDWFSNLLAISYTAELCYDEDPGEEKIRERFRAVCDGDYDAFFDMSLYHNSFDNPEEFRGGYNYQNRFIGQPLFWQDVLSGKYDKLLYERPMSAHYKKATQRYSRYGGGRWDYLYKHAKNVLEYLAVKCEIAENIAPAYKSGDKEMLERIANKLLPKLIELTNRTHESHRYAWMLDNKTSNFAAVDIKYAGVAARCQTAIILLKNYLSGEIDAIDELGEERLPCETHGFMNYQQIATPTRQI